MSERLSEVELEAMSQTVRSMKRAVEGGGSEVELEAMNQTVRSMNGDWGLLLNTSYFKETGVEQDTAREGSSFKRFVGEKEVLELKR